MDFLSTLAGNLPFLIVVLAGLFSLYKKFNSPGGSQPQQGKPRQSRPMSPMPTFGGGPGEGKKPVRKAVPNPWEEEQERRRREELAERQQEEWRREERAEAERRVRREEEEAGSRGGFGNSSSAGQDRAALNRSSPFQAPGAGRQAGSRMIIQDDHPGIGSIEAAAHTGGEWNPEGKDLAKAVVWSEILGPPRSKRPYRR